MILLPPITTLFPYTTLFRSLSPKRRTVLRLPVNLQTSHSLGVQACTSLPERELCPCSDRKSTRLNSSHVSISYAVFCLKKKNNQNICRFMMVLLVTIH